MPREIKNRDEFEKLIPTATEIRLVKDGENAKLKIRTPKQLYTFKTTEEEAEEMIKGTKTPVVEF